MFLGPFQSLPSSRGCDGKDPGLERPRGTIWAAVTWDFYGTGVTIWSSLEKFLKLLYLQFSYPIHNRPSVISRVVQSRTKCISRWGYTGIKSFSFLCGTQRILGQKVSTKSWLPAISLSHLREYCYYLMLSSNIRVKGDKMKRENNPIRLGGHFLSRNAERPTKET